MNSETNTKTGKILRKIRTLTRVLLIGAGGFAIGYTIEYPLNEVIQRHNNPEWSYAINLAENKIIKSRILSDNSWLKRQTYDVLNSTEINGRIGVIWGRMYLRRPTKIELGDTLLMANNYASTIVHERAHFWLRRNLSKEQRSRFSVLVKKGVKELDDIISRNVAPQNDVTVFIPVLTSIEKYKTHFGDDFEDEYWSDEAYAIIAGYVAEEALTNLRHNILPSPLRPFYEGFFHEEFLKVNTAY